MKDETYYFHQTPSELCLQLIEHVPIQFNDTVWEPFRGEGAFYNAIRKKTLLTEWSEIEEGRDYKDFNGNVDWIVTNPPFKLDSKACFGKLLMELMPRCNKGIAFFGNDYCFTALTSSRLRKINNMGFYLNKIVLSNVKKWRGRYYLMIFTREKNESFQYIDGTF